MKLVHGHPAHILALSELWLEHCLGETKWPRHRETLSKSLSLENLRALPFFVWLPLASPYY